MSIQPFDPNKFEIVSPAEYEARYGQTDSKQLAAPAVSNERSRSREFIGRNKWWIGCAVGVILVGQAVLSYLDHSEEASAQDIAEQIGTAKAGSPDDEASGLESITGDDSEESTGPVGVYVPEATDCDPLSPIIQAKTQGVIVPVLWKYIANTPEAPQDPTDSPIIIKGQFTISSCILDVKNGVVEDKEASETTGKTVIAIDPTKINIVPALKTLITDVASPNRKELKNGIRNANKDQGWDEDRIEFETLRLLTALDGARQEAVDGGVSAFAQKLNTDHAKVIAEIAKQDAKEDIEQQIAEQVDNPEDYRVVFKDTDDTSLPLDIPPPAPPDPNDPFTILSDQTVGIIGIQSLIEARN